MSTIHQFKVARTAHVYSLSTISADTKHIVIACHGYAQLASHFIQKFTAIERAGVFVAAPEGLSKFYWKGVTGEPAASWMTKHHRLDEIDDYCAYLQSVYDHYTALAPDATITLFGFSQGCATQMRWITHNFPAFDNLVLWGGMIPEDIDYLPFGDYFQDKRLFHLYGDQDEYLTPERMVFARQLIKESQLDIRVQQFKGTHRVYRAILKAFFEEKIFAA